MVDVVQRLRPGGRHDVLDEPLGRLRRLAGRGNVRRRGRRVVVSRFPQVFAVNERIVAGAVTHLPHDVGQVGVDSLPGEQALVELALYLFGELGPIAPDNLHANEFDAIGLGARAIEQPGVALTRSPRTMSRRGKE